MLLNIYYVMKNFDALDYLIFRVHYLVSGTVLMYAVRKLCSVTKSHVAELIRICVLVLQAM
jgi:hypothetical protein